LQHNLEHNLEHLYIMDTPKLLKYAILSNKQQNCLFIAVFTKIALAQQ